MKIKINNLKVTVKHKKGLSISSQNKKFIYTWKFQWLYKTGFDCYIIDIENLQYILDYFKKYVKKRIELEGRVRGNVPLVKTVHRSPFSSYIPLHPVKNAFTPYWVPRLKEARFKAYVWHSGERTRSSRERSSLRLHKSVDGVVRTWRGAHFGWWDHGRARRRAIWF